MIRVENRFSELKNIVQAAYDEMCFDSDSIRRVTREDLNDIWNRVRSELARGLRL